jgi:hypothetical protein
MFETPAPSHAATLFEKAQGCIGTMQQIDSQISQLLHQRKGVQTELASVQEHINQEFGRLMRESDELPAKVLAEISGGAARIETAAAPEARRRRDVAQPQAAPAETPA